MSATFDHLAEVLDRIANTSSRNRKLGVLADWLSALPDADLERGARFLCGEPVAGTGDRKLSIGHSILREAAVAATGFPIELFRLCHREVGDTSETIALLMEGKSAGESLSLAEAEQAYLRLFAERKTALKVELLQGMLERMRPKTTKYFLKVITGNFRIGMQQKLVEDALARATGAKLAEVRDAANRTGDLAQVARAARAGTLAALEMKLFHPLEFMLARPLDDVEDLVEPESWWVEDKYDGIRSQVHTDGGKVRIFTRGMEDTTAAFPDVVEALVGLPGSAVVDGELLAWREGRALNFTVLQQRLARKKVDASLIDKVPVVFVAYDLLYRDGALLLDAAIETRRQKLESLFEGVGLPLMVSRQWRLSSREALEDTFTGARIRGNEGLLLKKTGSLYESAKRSAEWLKVKRPYGTLDVVVTAAEQGSGRRATLLSDYTFAVKDGERFLNVGKAYSGLTDDEIRELTRLLRSISKERFGRVTLVEPKVVLEVAFDGVQKSPRHKCGYALRFPRIVRWRKDKEASEIDGLERVRELYERSLA
ncbi:MAG: cisplatin damage response ATP-dependent DNA ligase [Acidobacteria bacterium]|nr:cisplatin damage response ATP-dependent DNA ligase [Acidobacteriota bacterium]